MPRIGNRRNLTLTASLTWPTGGRQEGRRAALRLTDRESGMEVCEIEMDAETFADLISGRHTGVTAEFIGETIIHRLGRRYVHETCEIPDEFRRGGGTKPTPEMLAYAEEQRTSGGWESASWTRHNFGWRLTVARYEETPAADAPAEKD